MREQIVEVADRQLRSGGWSGLNFGTIATELEVSRANLHYHFGNKESLATAAVEAYVDGALSSMVELVEAHDGDIAGLLDAVEEAIIDRVRLLGTDATCMCTQLLRDAGAPDALRDASRRFWREKMRLLEKAMAAAQRAGTLTPASSPSELATEAIALLMGVEQLAMVIDDPKRFAARAWGTTARWAAAHRAEG
ncbi:MAG: TetR/AcrR family transcriptional regulator [Actinomycetota bacterium]